MFTEFCPLLIYCSDLPVPDSVAAAKESEIPVRADEHELVELTRCALTHTGDFFARADAGADDRAHRGRIIGPGGRAFF